MKTAPFGRVSQRVQRGFLTLTVLMATVSAGRISAALAQQPGPDLTDMSLEDLMKIKVESVYSVSKYTQPVTQAPSSVTIVTSDEIRKYGYRTLADILASVSGLYITYDRNYSYLGMRGFGRTGGYNPRVLLLVDGHRINDIIYEQALIGTEFPVDIDLIDRVEISRGPSSSLYGSNAVLGVINVITKKAKMINGFQFSGNLASFGTKKGRVTYGQRFSNGLGLLLSASFYTSDGPSRLYFKEFDSPATNNGIAQNCDDDEFEQLFANVSFGDFTFEGAYGTRDKGIPTASYDTVFDDARNRTTDSRGYVEFRYQHKFSNEWELTGRLYYDQYDYDGTYVYDYTQQNPPSLTLNKDYAHAKWWGSEVQLTKTLFKHHKLSFGSEFRRDDQQVQGDYDVDPHYLYLDDHRNNYVSGVYVQDDYSLRGNLILSAGVRYDHYGTFGGTTNPRVGLIYNPLEKTTVKLIYGTAFRAPNAYELYYSSLPEIPNPNLRPETVQDIELVAEQYFGNHLRVTGDIFQNRAHSLIDEETNADGTIQFKNSGSAVARGFETDLEGKWSSGINTRLSYTFQTVRDRQTGNILVDSPRHMANFNLIVPLVKNRLFAGLDVLYNSSRMTLGGQKASGFVLPNATLVSLPLGKGLELSASVYNLFDTKYGYPGGIENQQDILYQDGRTFGLKLTYTFWPWRGHSK